MKIYKEFVLIGIGCIFAILVTYILVTSYSDTHPTVDHVTPVPLELNGDTNENTNTKE